ncbi:nucleotidyltransferase domain-containing protein [Pontibacillus yanchengensis]|uniref:Amino acid transporter n=1 Tax=Pontibacillus yanchengensis Y32 TaxID=1385514 RepID=A0A0A2TCB4_9BACI|nr:hypothetical protein [Pontibacillus yanchengensis]KGP73452.1 hypothetical protein N782_05345 [Pontibacillus yanchengensis Y32]
MRIDIDNWNPITVSEVNEVFSKIPINWCIAGGWALDIHMGEETREHKDIDVIIFREDQQVLYKYLYGAWDLYKAENGKLEAWIQGEYLCSKHDIWVSKDANSSWAFQIMLVDTENDEWIYQREKSIRASIEEIIHESQDGIPYIKPEIQLLYKAGSSIIRNKDFQDFQTILPFLDAREKKWLRDAINKQFPCGHYWLNWL